MIGIFNDSFPPAIDGVGIGQYFTALELHKAGYDVRVVTTEAEGEPFDEPFPVTRLPTILIPQRKPYGYGITNLPSKKVAQTRNTEFDIIHAHSPFSVGHFGRRIARAQGIPFIATFHSKFKDDIMEATNSEIITERVLRRIMDFFSSADELWIADISIKDTLEEYGYHGPVEIIPIGIDTAGITDYKVPRKQVREELQMSEDQPLFLYVGQQIMQKNIELTLESLALLDDVPYKMLFCGTGNALDYFKERAEELGIADKTIFTGLVADRRKLMSYYAAADLFLFPSLYDTFGTVIREAAAMHTPSLLLRGSTCATFVEEGVNGYTAAEETPESYAGRIREILNNRHNLQAVSNEVARTLGQPWSEIVVDIAARYEKLIRDNKLKRGNK